MDDPHPALPSVALVGAGALGRALAPALRAAGVRLDAVVSRTRADAEALAARIGAPTASDRLADLPVATPCVICCVPDDAITPVAAELAAAGGDWTGRTVLHTSGAHGAAALAPLAGRGAAVLSFHPLQTFPPGSTPDVFRGIFVALEGDDAALPLGRRLAEALGARHVTLAAEAKPRYHLAATMASNFLVTLMALVDEVLGDAGIDAADRGGLVRPLVDRTWANLQQGRPDDVLTGPVARGDAATVQTHLAALRTHLPHLLPVYAALAGETVRVATRGGRLAPSAAEALLDHLHDALTTPDAAPSGPRTNGPAEA